VFLPDDPFFYATCDPKATGLAPCADRLVDGKPTAAACAKEAARRVLVAARFFKLDGADLAVDWKPAKDWEQVTVNVRATFDCALFLGSKYVCGLDGVAQIQASSTLNYQQGLTRTQAGK
jgi:hypothetical protein